MKNIVVDGREIAPSKILCVGRNYVEHINELGNEIPDDMVVFLKPNSAVSNELRAFHGEQLHYEAEICFICEGGTFSAVGFGLDLTKRVLQSRLKSKGLPWERAKSFDGSAVFSEFVRLPQSVSRLGVELAINGSIVQSGHTDLMIYKPQEILSELQTFMTLTDGDVVMTGTPKGVGTIQAGDEFAGSIMDDKRVLVGGRWIAR